MEQDISLDDPARAFDDLRREVSLGLRAIQGLAAEHRDQPDYRETLKVLDDRLAGIGKTLVTIADSPAMRLTPDELTYEIVKASEKARFTDAETLRSAGVTSQELIHQLRLGIGQVRVSAEQRAAVQVAVAVGIAIGILIWAILPGAFMRTLPASWHAPEWMATRAMRADELQASRRLFRVAHPLPALQKVDAAPLVTSSSTPISRRPVNHRPKRPQP